MRNRQYNITLLIVANILSRTASIAVLSVSALVAFELSADKRLTTLPLALAMAVDTLLKFPAAFFMQRFGRRPGFMLGASAGICSALLAALAIQLHSFLLFATAAGLSGVYFSFALYYPFAAAEAASEAHRARAISWVVSGGIIAAIAGPGVGRLAGWGGGNGYTLVFLMVALLATLALLTLARLSPTPAAVTTRGLPARPLLVIVKQPAFFTAVAVSAAGYAVMTSIMGSTPLAMKLCGLPAAASAGVIQWHMLGMFIPSLFTGELIRRFGLLPVISGGVVLIGAAVATAVSGQSLAHFVIALSVLGVGWNFLFIGGSTLLLTALRPGEQAKGQGCYDFVVFGVASASSLVSGGLLAVSGWNAVTTFTLPLLLLAAVMIVILWSRRVATHQE